jgi:hypothetical protein
MWCKIWGSYDSAAEDASVVRCDTVDGWLVPNVLKAPWSFRMLGSTYPAIHRRIMDDLNPQWYPGAIWQVFIACSWSILIFSEGCILNLTYIGMISSFLNLWCPVQVTLKVGGSRFLYSVALCLPDCMVSHSIIQSTLHICCWEGPSLKLKLIFFVTCLLGHWNYKII